MPFERIKIHAKFVSSLRAERTNPRRLLRSARNDRRDIFNSHKNSMNRKSPNLTCRGSPHLQCTHLCGDCERGVRIASGIDFLHQAKTNFGCMTNPPLPIPTLLRVEGGDFRVTLKMVNPH
jgi:hypothetical protein